MKVTVLLAVHDGMPWIGDAVDSVLAQTDGDFELIVVDDASEDGTAEALAAYDDPRIRILRNERNLGQVPSLNRGLREARGDYVARLDADDWSTPDRLERQAAVLDEQPRVGLVGSWMDLVDEQGRRVWTLRARLDDLVSYVYATLVMRVYVSHPAAMYRREPVLRLGGYDESMGPSEDRDLWRRLLLDGWDARIVPEPLVAYRLHDAQLSKTQSARQRERDRTSQERFIAALAPDVQPRPVLLLLAGAPELWHEDAAEALRALDPVLAGAAARFGLDAGDARRLEELVARRVVEVAARRPWSSGSRALVGWSSRRLGRQTVLRMLFTWPLREGLRVAGQADALAPLRSRLSGSWALRRLYGRFVGND